MTNIAFIGVGIMGVRQAANLMKAGYPLTVYARTASKAAPLVAKGAKLAASPAEAGWGVASRGSDFSATAAVSASMKP